MRKVEFKAIETFAMTVSLWWALALALPSQTFSIALNYEAMAMIAPEPLWALLFLVVGSIHFWGMYKKDRKIKQFGLTVASALWVFVGMMFITSFVVTYLSGATIALSTASITYIAIGCLCGWLSKKVGEQ